MLPSNCLKLANGGLKPRATTAGSSIGLFSSAPEACVLIDLHEVHAVGGEVSALAARVGESRTRLPFIAREIREVPACASRQRARSRRRHTTETPKPALKPD